MSALAILDGAPHATWPVLGGCSLFETTEQRRRLLEGVLDWLTANLERFDPPQENQVVGEDPEKIGQGRARKAFGELGAALRLAARVPELRASNRVRTLRNHWLQSLDSRQVFFDVRRRAQLFPQMAVALAVATALDPTRRFTTERAALQAVLQRGFMDRVERSAWHKLDLKYYFDAGGLAHAFEDDVALLGASSLMAPPTLAWTNTMDLYGVTHLIFHFTDFGRRGFPAAAGFSVDGLCEYVTAATAMCMAERDIDLVAELLMSSVCLASPPNDLARAAVAMLCESQRPQGFVPDRRWMEGAVVKDAADDAETAEFFRVYHPTLVTLFLIACDMDRQARQRAPA